MEAATVARTRTAAETRTKAKTPKPQGTPWWMWLAVAAIVLFCLFPFYWMLNISLKTRSALDRSGPVFSEMLISQ